MSQGVLCQKIRFLGQKLWPLAGEHTDRQTEVLITKDLIRLPGQNFPFRNPEILKSSLFKERSNLGHFISRKFRKRQVTWLYVKIWLDAESSVGVWLLNGLEANRPFLNVMYLKKIV